MAYSNYTLKFIWPGPGRQSSIHGDFAAESPEDLNELIKLLTLLKNCHWLESTPDETVSMELEQAEELQSLS